MAKPSLSRLLVFGVDMGHGVRIARQSVSIRLAGELLDRLQMRQLAATWGLTDLSAPQVGLIRRLPVQQEVALDATSQTPKNKHDAFAFAAFLREQRQLAESQGISLRSLVLDPRGCVPYYAVAKLGFCIVRPGQGQSRLMAQSVQPQPLRYGLWGLPVSNRWPHANGLVQKLAERHLAHGLRRSNWLGAVLHVVFDLATMSGCVDGALRSVDRLLDTVAELRDQQQLQVIRLVDLAGLIRIAAVRQPMDSILRRSA